MEDNFDSWNENKKYIHAQKANKYYHARDIWWCSLGVNIGSEQNGDGKEYQRPVLIVRGLSATTCLAIPLTSSANKHAMRVPLGLVDGKEASALLSQLRVIDTKRLINKVGFLNEEAFKRTRKAILDLL